MPDPGDTTSSFPAGGDFSSSPPTDPIQPLMNLSALNSRMDSLHDFLSDSIARNVLLGSHQMEMVSAEISSAIHQVILNGSALLAFSQIPNPSPQNPNFPIPPNSSQPNTDPTASEPRSEPPVTESDEPDPKPDLDLDHEVIELDAVQILAEHVHFCQICGKGFKRDANLRMHMRAHGDQFKRPEALAKPPSSAPATLIGDSKSPTRFSCPFTGCNRNQRHRKFKPLKSVVCVRNHFKRSHCPKMYSCERCHKKSFSVLSDLRSHLKSCGESKWRCSCGTTFSRKDKLFGHMALFEGHMPAVGLDDDDKRLKIVDGVVTEEQGRRPDSVTTADNGFRVDDEFFDDEMLDEFAGINEDCMEGMFGSSYSPDFAQQFCDI